MLMKEKTKELKNIEKEYNVKTIYACESFMQGMSFIWTGCIKKRACAVLS